MAAQPLLQVHHRLEHRMFSPEKAYSNASPPPTKIGFTSGKTLAKPSRNKKATSEAKQVVVKVVLERCCKRGQCHQSSFGSGVPGIYFW